MPNLLEQIRDGLDALPPAERRVAQLVLADPRAFLQQPIARLAQQAQSSAPTVVRFCRSLGYEGLSDFRLRLAASLGDGVPWVHTAVAADDDTARIVGKVTDNVVSALTAWRNGAATRALDQAIDALTATIRAGRRIEFYGVGNSGIVAQDAQHKFFRLGTHTVAYSDGHLQVMAATLLDARDCVVIISNSGRSRDLLDATELARKQGARTIAITASGSPLAELADVTLLADHGEPYDRYSPMVSRQLHLLVVDILATGVALRLGPDLLPRLSAIKRNLRAKRYRAPA